MWVGPPMVDAHAHIYTDAMPLAPDAWTKPKVGHDVEQYLTRLDAHGIGFGVIAAISLFADDNAYVLNSLARHRGRLRATAVAPVSVGRRILQQFRDGGMVGVRLQLRNRAVMPDLSDAEHVNFLRRLADAGLHLELLARSADLPGLLPAIDRSGVDLVIDHLGAPDASGVASPGFEAMLRAIDNGRTLVKIAATTRIPFDLAKKVTDRLVAVAGAERLVWGSDSPFIGHEDTRYGDVVDIFARLVPDPAVRHAIGLTALRAWFW